MCERFGCKKMILLPALLLILWREAARCLEEAGNFPFDGDIRQYAVATNTVYIATDKRLYKLNHDLTLVQSLTLRGILNDAPQPSDAQFYRVSEADKWNATFTVNILLPVVEDDSLISCGVTDNECGYCELLAMKDISKVLCTEQIMVGSPWHSSASVSFLVNVEKTRTETYILAATQQREDKSTETSCHAGSAAVHLHNTNNDQTGYIFSKNDLLSGPAIQSKGNVDFVDGFQIDSVIYLFSNVLSKDKSNKVRLIWLEGTTGKVDTLKSLRGATLSISDGARGSRLLASSVVPGGPPVLWSGVFTVDGGVTNTVLVLFDISTVLTGDTDVDPDFCSVCSDKPTHTPKTVKQKKVLFRQDYMTSVLAVRQRAWMVFFIGTEDGQLIKLAVDKNFHTACPRVLYRTSEGRKAFPKIHLDPVDHKHVYVAFQNQMKRVPVSKCSRYTNVQDCWSAQDPYCVWCSSEGSCTFEDKCPDSDWVSIPDKSRQKMVSHKVVKDSTGQITLNIQTHMTVGQTALSKFACQFSASSDQICSMESPPQFPQCNCVLSDSTLTTEGLEVTVTISLGTTQLSEQLKLTSCADIRGPPTSVLCQQCVKAGCRWSADGCSWATPGVIEDNVCKVMEPGTNLPGPEISSISPSVVSILGRNHAVLSGRNLNDVTRVRIQYKKCSLQESPVRSNTGVNLTFHIPSTDITGVFEVCVVLPDGSCHGNATITYQSSPSCIKVIPSSTWVSGKRKITLTGLYLEFVEGVMHSHALQVVSPPRDANFQTLTYDTPAAENIGISTSSVFLKVANETLACSTTITYYPDPEITSFTTERIGDDVCVTIRKKADKLEMTLEELSVWGGQEGNEYPCIMKTKLTTNKTDFFTCEIQRTPEATFQHLIIRYGDKTVRLGPPAALHTVVLIVRFLLIPCIIAVMIFICQWQKKLTVRMNKI